MDHGRGMVERPERGGEKTCACVCVYALLVAFTLYKYSRIHSFVSFHFIHERRVFSAVEPESEPELELELYKRRLPNSFPTVAVYHPHPLRFRAADGVSGTCIMKRCTFTHVRIRVRVGAEQHSTARRGDPRADTP